MSTLQPRPSRAFLSRSGRIALLACAASAAPVVSLPILSASPLAPAQAQGLSGRTAAISINGAATDVSPPPVITRSGSVLVPLRGVLEKLGAQVSYTPSDKRIEVRQAGKLFILREGQPGAVAEGQSVALPAAPQRIGGSVYVPLRALAELFGYRVEWDNAAKSVLINTDASSLDTANHRLALQASRRFGVGIDFVGLAPAEVGPLLDLAKAAGVDMVQTRFDWNTLQPAKGGAFDFSLYDAVVSEAGKRNMILVGILGNSSRWASSTKSENPFEWRYNAPLKSELPSWSTYVQRVVSHFKNDVHAWQVWDQPTSWKLRTGGINSYIQLASTALTAARKADPKAIVHAAEPGGVNLTYLNALKNSPVLAGLDGVNLFPASQWQPGLQAAPEDALLPLNTYQSQLSLGPNVWVGGLWFPAIERDGVAKPNGYQFSRVSDERREQIFNTFSPADQADFLVKSATLSIAGGADKVLWNALRDDPAYEVVEPVNPEWGSGLVRRDNSPRPAFNALANLSRLIGDPKFSFIGALATGPDVVALAFDNGDVGHVVAWSPSGRGRITVNPDADPQVPGATFIQSRADSQVLFSTGDPAPLSGAYELGARPLWITRIAAGTVARAKEGRNPDSKYLQITRPLPRATDKNLARATFGNAGEENGLLWRKYAQWRGQAVKVEERGGEETLVSEPPPDALHPADGKPFLFFDVADDLTFFSRTATSATPTVTVRLRKSRPGASALTSNTAGFKVEYNTTAGSRSSRWQKIEDGDGFVEYSFDLPGASFANVDGSDLVINSFGSKQNVYVSGVTLKLNND